MKRRPVDFSRAALIDLETIYLYVLDKSRSAGVATKYVDRIVDRCERIGDAPHGGAPRPDLGDGIRLVPFEHSAVILYRVENGCVAITNVFHGGRDYQSILRDGDSG